MCCMTKTAAIRQARMDVDLSYQGQNSYILITWDERVQAWRWDDAGDWWQANGLRCRERNARALVLMGWSEDDAQYASIRADDVGGDLPQRVNWCLDRVETLREVA
jgi:hypothetical protein